MTKDQMEMLSVKSAIERTIAGLAASYTADVWKDVEAQITGFFSDVERYVASLYVSRQIDSDFAVCSTNNGIKVVFSTRGHFSQVTYFLPKELWWSNLAKNKALQELSLAPQFPELDVDLTKADDTIPVGDVTYFETQEEYPYIDPEVLTQAQEQVRAMIESRNQEAEMVAELREVDDEIEAYRRAMKVVE